MPTARLTAGARLIGFTLLLGACSDANAPGPAIEAERVLRPAFATQGDVRIQFFKADGRLSADLSTSTMRVPAALDASRIEYLRAQLSTNSDILKPAEVKRANAVLDLLAAGTRDGNALRALARHVEQTRGVRKGASEWTYFGASGHRLFDVTDNRGRSSISSFILDCSEYYPGSMPDECMDYDPYWDPQPTLDQVAGLQSEVSAGEFTLLATEAELSAAGALAGDPCRAERYRYYQTVQAFLMGAGATIGFSVFRQVGKAATSLFATWAALWEVNIARVGWDACMEQAREQYKQSRGADRG